MWHARSEVPAGYEVRNVVFMGMGEPLDNFDSVRAALRGLTHQATLSDDTAPSARRVAPKARGAPAHPRALAVASEARLRPPKR